MYWTEQGMLCRLTFIEISKVNWTIHKVGLYDLWKNHLFKPQGHPETAGACSSTFFFLAKVIVSKKVLFRYTYFTLPLLEMF